MSILSHIWQTLLQFPEYWPGAVAALSLIALALPLYFGMWYFLKRRNLAFPWNLRIACLGSFILFAGLAFIFSTPISNKIPALALNAYLFLACCMAAYTFVPLIDVFVLEYFLIGKKKVYISPPLHKVINIVVFCLFFLPTMHYLLRFHPSAQIAFPTIITAGIALALQDTFKAFFAGVGLGQLIRIGDWISFQDKEGRVVDINWARTALHTMHGDLLWVPNTLLLAQPFLNYSTQRSNRFILKIGVAYTAPPDKVKAVLSGCAQNVQGLANYPAPIVQVMAFKDLSITYGLFYWVEDYATRYQVQDELATRAWNALHQEGFEMPFPAPTYNMDEGFHPVATARTSPAHVPEAKN